MSYLTTFFETSYKYTTSWDSLDRELLIKVFKILVSKYQTDDVKMLNIMRATMDIRKIEADFAKENSYDYDFLKDLKAGLGEARFKKLPLLYLDELNLFLTENTEAATRFLKQFDLTNDTLKHFNVELVKDYTRKKWKRKRPKEKRYNLEVIKLVGPGNFFENTTFLEYIHADYNFVQYLKTEKAEYLDKLVACLYRPIGANERAGDEREQFSVALMSKRAEELMKYVKNEFKLAAFYYYVSCKRKAVEVYSQGDNPVFKVDDEDMSQELPKSHEDRKKNIGYFNWTPHLFEFAKSPIWNGKKGVENELFLHILEYIQDDNAKSKTAP